MTKLDRYNEVVKVFLESPDAVLRNREIFRRMRANGSDCEFEAIISKVLNKNRVERGARKGKEYAFEKVKGGWRMVPMAKNSGPIRGASPSPAMSLNIEVSSEELSGLLRKVRRSGEDPVTVVVKLSLRSG